MRKTHKILSMLFIAMLMVAYNNCGGQVQFAAPKADNSTVTPEGTGAPSAPLPPTQLLVPLQSLSSIAYEDSYPAHGDADFNDFLTAFEVTEIFNSNNDISDIYIDFYPRAASSGDDAQLKLVLTGVVTGSSLNAPLPATTPLFNGTAQVTVTIYDSSLTQVSSTTVPYNQDIIVFPSTHNLFGVNAPTIANGFPSSPFVPSEQNARIHVALNNPELNPGQTGASAGTFNTSLLRAILHPGSGYDIDTINVNPKNYDSAGYPFAFVVPTDWQWMQESKLIDDGYPVFPFYRQYLLGQTPNTTLDYMHWFNQPVTGIAAAQLLYPVVPSPTLLPAP